jgi:hypothetical protein
MLLLDFLDSTKKIEARPMPAIFHSGEFSATATALARSDRRIFRNSAEKLVLCCCVRFL